MTLGKRFSKFEHLGSNEPWENLGLVAILDPVPRPVRHRNVASITGLDI